MSNNYVLQTKCECYWPLEVAEAKQYGEIVVQTTNCSTINTYDFRIFQLSMVRPFDVNYLVLRQLISKKNVGMGFSSCQFIPMSDVGMDFLVCCPIVCFNFLDMFVVFF